MSNTDDLFSTQETDVVEPTDMCSGLHSSEIDESLTYTDMSSVEPSATLRPGVNEERSTINIGMQQRVIYGTDINIDRIMENFNNFFLQFKTNNLDEEFITDIVFNPEEPLYIQKMNEIAKLKRNYININCEHLVEFDNSLCQHLIVYPKEVIPAMDCVIDNIFKSRYNSHKIPIQTRPYNCETSRNLRNLNPEDLDQLVTVTGLVTQLSNIIPEMTRGHFKCSVCDFVLKEQSDRGRIIEPEFCRNCHSKFTCKLIHNLSDFCDKQRIKLQESPDDMPPGETPHVVTLYCYQDLVDTVFPGDRIIVTGIYRAALQRENPRQRTVRSELNPFIDALHFRKSESQLRGEENTKFSSTRIEEINQLSKKPDLYERLSGAIAPSIYGNENIKKGILLMLFGSYIESKEIRSNIHILLCGDPGTSKSQFLQFVHHLAPRTQYTSGKGSSEVGLTAFVSRDPETNTQTLQSGALAMADNGICLIDEFDKMSEITRSVLHEVMEQQTISIAKAGIICTVNARCSVLVAANPVGSCWDSKKTIIDNIKLPPTLLSRFDLIFLMLDPEDEVYDARLARHIANLYTGKKSNDADADGSVNRDLLRDYIAYAKDNIKPRLTKEAEDYLTNVYIDMRRAGREARGQVSAYPRQLESLARLSLAHARMRLSDTVNVDDCVEAVRLHREALKQAAVDPLTGLIDINILTTGITGGLRKQKEEVARAIYAVLDAKRVITFQYERVLEEVRSNSDMNITRDMFEDGLNYLKLDNKINWAGKTIRKL